MSKRKYKEIIHSHYKLELENSGGKSWEEILSNFGKELDKAEHKINPESVVSITIKSGIISIETITCAEVNLDAPIGEKVIYWGRKNE